MVVTGSRADYGPLYWLMREIDDDPDLDLSVVVTGQHLMPAFGETWKTIADDGFDIAHKLDIGLGGDKKIDAARATGRALTAVANLFEDNQPDIVIILGDRFEIFAVASAACLMGVPIAHLHGGELTEGAFDDQLRHAITKMAHFHFVADSIYGNRVIQMGEQPERVMVTGAPGLDHLYRSELPDRAALTDRVGLDLSDGFLLVTFHPETRGEGDPGEQVSALIDALAARGDCTFVITGVNSDPGYGAVAEQISAFASSMPNRVCLVTSLGQAFYWSALREADAVIGNSSSGVIEAPAVPTPSVNIGDRQKGRLRAPSVIDCPADTARITGAIDQALSPSFRAMLSAPATVDGKSSIRIKEHLKHLPLDQIGKPFHDIAGASIVG
jgi:UDP-hydrolysing UDP-N-acetyl-D-glucosamine 2-epimerase